MTDYVLESFHDLMGESEAISDSDSSGGSHHHSLECFMADTPEGHIKSVHDGNTPLNSPAAGDWENSRAPPRAAGAAIGALERAREGTPPVRPRARQARVGDHTSQRWWACARQCPQRESEDPRGRRGPPTLHPGKPKHRCRGSPA
jgi:hypothetical protein